MDGEDQLDRPSEKLCITYSEGREEYPTCNKQETDLVDLLRLAQEQPCKRRYQGKDRGNDRSERNKRKETYGGAG